MSLPGVAIQGIPQLDPALNRPDQPDQSDHPHNSSPSHSASSTSFHLRSSRTKKSRREKPRIELAPDQPLTTQGRPRARVYVACLQCRTRKIRCDGAKPTCHNCTRRANPTQTTEACIYDAAPKRRGPDKTPGARQRTSRETRQEGGTHADASRRPRRKRRDIASPLPQTHFPPFPASAYPPTPPNQPSIVLDPQLVDILPYHSTPTASPSPVHPGSGRTPSRSVIPDPLPLDGTLHHVTSSQVST